MEKYPDTYLHVIECHSGEEWIRPLRGNTKLDLRKLITRWAKDTFGGDVKIDGALMPKLDGDYYGKIMTDGRAPNSPICWTGAGFYLKPTYE